MPAVAILKNVAASSRSNFMTMVLSARGQLKPFSDECQRKQADDAHQGQRRLVAALVEHVVAEIHKGAEGPGQRDDPYDEPVPGPSIPRTLHATSMGGPPTWAVW